MRRGRTTYFIPVKGHALMGSLLNLVQRARGAQLDFDITKLSDAELLQLIVKVSVAWLNKDRRRTGTEPLATTRRAGTAARGSHPHAPVGVRA